MTTLKNGRASPADAALKPKDANSNVKSPGVSTGTAQPGLTQDDEAARHHRDAERNDGGESANATTSRPPREEEDGLPAAPNQEEIDALVAHGWTHDQALRALSNPVRVTPPSNPEPDESKVGATPDEEAPSAAAERSLDPNVEDESTTKKATTPPKATAPSTKAPPASGDELNLMFDAPPASIEDSPEDAPDAAHGKQTSGDLFSPMSMHQGAGDDVPIGTPEEADHHADLVDEASAQKGGAIHESTPTTGRGVGNALDGMSDGMEGRGAGTLQEDTATTGRGAGKALDGEGLGDGLQQPDAPPPTLQQQDEEAGAATTQPTVAKPDAAGVEGEELDALAEQPTTPAAGEAPVENVNVDPFAVPGVGTRTPPETESADPSTDPSETDTGDPEAVKSMMDDLDPSTERSPKPTGDPGGGKDMMDTVDQPSATMYMEPEDGDPDGPRVLPAPPDAPAPRELAATPRPAGAYPESTAHSEVVGYLYDPSRDSVVAARVGMREPEVTAWGDARPLAIEREVGAWDLTPTDDGIVLDEHDVEVEVPPVVARRLRAEAQKRPGEIIVVYEVRDYSHDIPTSTTTPSRRLQVLEDEPGDETTGWFTLEAGYAGGSGGRRETPDLRKSPNELKRLVEKATKAAKQKRGKKPKRQLRRKTRKADPYRAPPLPQIVVVQERAETRRRFGGL